MRRVAVNIFSNRLLPRSNRGAGGEKTYPITLDAKPGTPIGSEENKVTRFFLSSAN